MVEQAGFATGSVRPDLLVLGERCGAKVWVKHENHTPIGAFKLRGGIVYTHYLRRERPEVTGVLTATRGNHGQSVAFAARAAGLDAVVVVPRGNSIEKNAAMRALGAELIEHGNDFQESYEFAAGEAPRRGLHMVTSFRDGPRYLEPPGALRCLRHSRD